MKWTQGIISTRAGERLAIEPEIISASRATDIPAFHARWLLNRLSEGYCLWKNPFNPSQSQYVSFKKCRLIVFWSKNPEPLLPHLRRIEDMGLQFCFHFTINDYIAENLEPGLPPLARRIAAFRRLSERFGRERLIWRHDPIILGAGLDVAVILKRITRLAEQIAPFACRLVFSFVDFYRKTERNLGRINPDFRAPTRDEAKKLAEGLAHPLLPVYSCAENLVHPKIRPSSCIDPELVKKLCPDLAAVLPAAKTQKALQLPLLPSAKDISREKLCGCIPAKDIGTYDSCSHGCVYCYACNSKNSVLAKLRRMNVDSENL